MSSARVVSKLYDEVQTVHSALIREETQSMATWCSLRFMSVNECRLDLLTTVRVKKYMNHVNVEKTCIDSGELDHMSTKDRRSCP